LTNYSGIEREADLGFYQPIPATDTGR